MNAPRHYLSYVKPRLIADWKVEAVIGDSEFQRVPSEHRLAGRKRAEQKRQGLLGATVPRVWPWAFQLGATPAAKSLKRDDVVWVVARLRGLGVEWPPALVACLELAEDARFDEADWSMRKKLPFPFHFGVQLFTRPGGGRFFAANDATEALLTAGYKTELRNAPDPDRLARCRDAHIAAWRTVSKTGFGSLRRICDPAPLQQLAKRLDNCSTFISYSWTDYEDRRGRSGGMESAPLRELVEELMVKRGIGVWLDQLTLPTSGSTTTKSRNVIEQLLRTPLREIPLVVACITEHYGGPSTDRPEQEGYTLWEWKNARQILSWEREGSHYEHLLNTKTKPNVVPSTTSTPADVANDVARLLHSASGR